MTTVATSTPTNKEIHQQLDHMLTVKRFAGAPNQARLLTFAVTEVLKGERAIKESAIALALFPHLLQEESTDVRVTAFHLRNRLRRYYAQEGQQDRVIISLPEPHCGGTRLPPGAAYLPCFAYNPRLAKQADTPEAEPSALEPFVSAAKAARFVDVNRRYLLVLARNGIQGAYPLGTGTKRRIWRFRLSELASAIARSGDPQNAKTVRSSGSGSPR
jgi:hypothetical protein